MHIGDNILQKEKFNITYILNKIFLSFLLTTTASYFVNGAKLNLHLFVEIVWYESCDFQTNAPHSHIWRYDVSLFMCETQVRKSHWHAELEDNSFPIHDTG